MIKLSASKISTFLTCSYKGYSTYLNHFPRIGGDGTKLGSATHLVLECLIHPKRRDWGEKILKAKTAFIFPSIKKLASIHLKRERILSEETLAKIDGFILVALKNDFYCEGAYEIKSELPFDIKTDTYHINGFIDILAFYPNKILLKDFKSSKSKPAYFNSKDYFGIQALMYELAVTKMYPGTPVEVEFQYLKFKKACSVKSPKSSPELLKGFEEWLGYLTEYIGNFDSDKKFSNLAVSNGQRFAVGGCGGCFGETRKDGGDVYICDMKYPRIFFVLKDSTGKVIKSATTKKELEKHLKDGCIIEDREHQGCPVWKHLWEKR